MNKYSCIIIDDEAYAIAGLEQYLASFPHLELVKTYTDPLKALLELLSSEPVDLLLMDIDMPQISGIDLARELRHKTGRLVFTTSHTKFGYEAFQVDADAYLLKPYSLSKFAATINKLFPLTEPLTNSGKTSGDDFFFAKNKYEGLKLVKVMYEEVIAIESKQNYVLIYTPAKNILTYISLTEIGKAFTKLPNFIRFQRSFIINKNQILTIDGHTIRMSNGLAFTVGNYYRKAFFDFIQEKTINAGHTG